MALSAERAAQRDVTMTAIVITTASHLTIIKLSVSKRVEGVCKTGKLKL